MEFGDPLSDRQSQAVAAPPPLFGLGLRKAVEDLIDERGRDPRALVADDEMHPFAFAPGADRDATIGGAEPDGVADEIVEHRPQQVGHAVDAQVELILVADEPRIQDDGVLPGHGRAALDTVHDELVDLIGAGDGREGFAVADAGEEQEALDHAPEPAEFFTHAHDELLDFGR